MPEDEKDDEGTVDLSLVGTIVGVGAKLIPGEGGEEDLRKCVTSGLKFADKRELIPDEAFDIDD